MSYVSRHSAQDDKAERRVTVFRVQSQDGKRRVNN